MKLFGFNVGRSVAPVMTQLGMDQLESLPGVSIVHFSRPEMPTTKESSRFDWVEFGEDNDYPDQLIKWLSTSPIHNAVVTSKAKMMGGQGILFDGVKPEDLIPTLDPQQASLLSSLVTSPNPDHDLEELVRRLAFDFQLFGGYALESIFSVDRSRISELRHVPMNEVRSGKKQQDGKVHDFYVKDWSVKRDEPHKISAFGEDNGSYNQLMYVRNVRPGLKYYGEPGYTSALSWIAMEAAIGEFHLGSIKNGFSPSIAIKFFKKPTSPEEMDEIVRGVKKQFTIGQNGQKVMIFFSDGKELAPELEPLKVENIDRQLVDLQDQITQQVISAHRVTSPLILGIAQAGKLNSTGGEDLKTAFNVFDKIVIGPDRALLEKTLRQVCKLWGIKAKPSIEKLDPLI